MELMIGIITVGGVIVTIVWFIRDIRRENSKILKTISAAQQSALEIQKSALEVQKYQTEILAKIEEGQRKGFQALEEGQRRGFQTLEEGQRKGFQALEEGLKYLADIFIAVSGKSKKET